MGFGSRRRSDKAQLKLRNDNGRIQAVVAGDYSTA